MTNKLKFGEDQLIFPVDVSSLQKKIDQLLVWVIMNECKYKYTVERWGNDTKCSILYLEINGLEVAHTIDVTYKFMSGDKIVKRVSFYTPVGLNSNRYNVVSCESEDIDLMESEIDKYMKLV